MTSFGFIQRLIASAAERKHNRDMSTARRLQRDLGINWRRLHMDIKRGYAPSKEWELEFGASAWGDDLALRCNIVHCLNGGAAGVNVVVESAFFGARIMSVERVDRSGPAWLVVIDTNGHGEIRKKLVHGDIEMSTAIVQAVISMKSDAEKEQEQ